MSAADYLAHEIEWARARDRARLKSERRGRAPKVTAAEEFDPHAATELADLIEHRMRKSTP